MHWTTTLDIIINVIVQIINLVIFFFIFYKLFSKQIISALEERRSLLNKIKNAQDEYESILQDAQAKSKTIIDEWLAHKSKILDDAKILAENSKATILEQAQKKAQDIVEGANKDAELLRKDLTDNFELWVKQTAKSLVQKLLDKDVQLQDSYVNELLTDLQKSK